MRRRLPTEGFTIIEVLIVLAIAALILLIIFIAVPGVERSSRNAQRKHDAGYLLVQRQNYDQDNSTVIAAGQATCNSGGGGTFGNFCTYLTQGMSYYTPDKVTIVNSGFSPPTTIPTVDPEKLITESYLICNDTQTGATATGAGAHDVVVLYALEGGSGQINECLQGNLVTGI